MDKWLEYIIEIQSIAQIGLTYVKDPFDKERYERLREISAEMLAEKTGESVEKVKGLFCNETGYQTPKIDTRAAVFKDGKILLVHEKNGTWSLPGGWCDVLQSVGNNAVKEVKEETGLDVLPSRIIAVQDRNRHNVPVYCYGVVKIFILCKLFGGEFVENTETLGFDYFNIDNLPENLATEKTTKAQIETCFKAYLNPNLPVEFD